MIAAEPREAGRRQPGQPVMIPSLIESLYFKRFGRDHPAVVVTLEEHARQQERKKEARKAARKRAREEPTALEEAEAVVQAAITGP
jgi:hypothetical protein